MYNALVIISMLIFTVLEVKIAYMLFKDRKYIFNKAWWDYGFAVVAANIIIAIGMYLTFFALIR